MLSVAPFKRANLKFASGHSRYRLRHIQLMNKSTLLALASLLFTLGIGSNLLMAQPVPAAEVQPAAAPNQTTNAVLADVNDLIVRINGKLDQGKNTETDLADNLKEFDALVAKHKDAPAEDRAMILVKKAQLYMEVLGEPEKAVAIFKQIKTDFPTTQVAGHADEIVADLQGAVEKKQIREKLAPGNSFPDFRESDVNGKPLSISQFKGKVVLVDFWATWCPPCIREVPEIQKAYAKFHDQGFEIVGISLDVDKESLLKFTAEKKMPWPEFFDGKKWENKLAVKYGVDATPTSYLLDRHGKIIKQLAPEDDLETEVAKALKM